MSGLHIERGGAGSPLLVLLHGLGAHGSVWAPMLEHAEREWRGAWLAPDLRGHGRSAWADGYGLDDHAGDVAEAMRDAGATEGAVILGHSMGGAVGLALASGRHRVTPAFVLGVGIKVAWTESETAWLAKLAASAVRYFATREEAAERFLTASGLTGLAEAASAMAERGIIHEEQGWRLAADPATALIGPPPMDGLCAEALRPFRLAAGEHDPMSRLDDLRRWDRNAEVLPGLGHNAMVENPAAVWAALRRCAEPFIKLNGK